MYFEFSLVHGQSIRARQDAGDLPRSSGSGPVLGSVVLQSDDVLEAGFHVVDANAGNGAALGLRHPACNSEAIEPTPIGLAGEKVGVRSGAVVGEVED